MGYTTHESLPKCFDSVFLEEEEKLLSSIGSQLAAIAEHVGNKWKLGERVKVRQHLLRYHSRTALDRPRKRSLARTRRNSG